MESRILGVPLAVWCFILGLGVIISLPMYLFHVQDMQKMTEVENVCFKVVASTQPVVVTPAPTEVPPTATPTARLLAPVTKPVAPTTP